MINDLGESRGGGAKSELTSKCCYLAREKCYNGYTIGHPLCTHFFMPRKDTGFRIRVESGLHKRFLLVCRAQDRPAAQVIREFMRGYIEENWTSVQGSLFDNEENFRNKVG